MNFFYSFSFKNMLITKNPLDKNIWKLSIELVRKHYKNVYLITDNYGEKHLEDLNFTKIYKVLNDIPTFKTNQLWAIGKIYAYKYICENFGSFCHVDSDAFLWEPLPERLINSKIFVENLDLKKNSSFLDHSAYDINKFNKHGLCIPEIWNNSIMQNKNIKIYNMGLFGGSDTKTILNYCNFVINMLESERYRKTWETEVEWFNKYGGGCLSCMLEQFNFAIFCFLYSVQPETYFSCQENKQKESYKKYTHLMELKNDSRILNRIKDRFKDKNFNLSPRNVSIENW